MSAAVTNCPAATPPPLYVRRPAPGRVPICTATRSLAGLSFASVRRKSARLKTTGVSSATVTVRSTPTGASFTAVTVMDARAVAVENALVPPLVVVLAVPAALPVVPSQARNVKRPGSVPWLLAAGRYRTAVLASARNSTALAVVGAEKAVHPTPPLVVYSHAPWVVSTSTTAIPMAAAPSTSDTCPAINADTRVPSLSDGSSSIETKLFAPARTGASLAPSTVTTTVPKPVPPALLSTV